MIDALYPCLFLCLTPGAFWPAYQGRFDQPRCVLTRERFDSGSFWPGPGRVGSAGLCDLKILHPWRRLKKGVKILQWPPPTLEKGGQYSTSVWKVCKKRGKKSTILKNIWVKILQVWKWGSKFYMLKNRVKILQCLKKGGSIFYIRPQK